MNPLTLDIITVGALGIRFLIEAADSDGTAAVFECYLPANAWMLTPHSHDGFEETIYGLEGARPGRSTARRSRSVPARPCACPAVRCTGFENDRSADATLLAIATPTAFGPSYFREIGKGLAASTGAPPDLAAIGAVMRRHRPHLRLAERCLTTCLSRSPVLLAQRRSACAPQIRIRTARGLQAVAAGVSVLASWSPERTPSLAYAWDGQTQEAAELPEGTLGQATTTTALRPLVREG
jgi:hypothetical protein